MKMGAFREIIFHLQVQCGEAERQTTAFVGVEEAKMRSFNKPLVTVLAGSQGSEWD